MRKKCKRFLALLLAVVTVLGTTGIVTFAATEPKAEEPEGTFKYLSDISYEDLVIFEQPLGIDKSYWQGELAEGQEYRPLEIFGTEYEKGLGMHSNMSVTYKLNGTCSRFTAVIGPDASCNSTGQMGHMGAKIYLDGKEVFYKVMDIRDKTTVFDVDLDLSGVQELKIEGTPEGVTWSDSFVVGDAKVWGYQGSTETPVEGAGTFASFDIALPENAPLEGIGIIDKNNIYVTVPDDTDLTSLKAVFAADGIVTVGNEEQVSGETVNDFTNPVTYTVTNEKGAVNYTVHVGNWEIIPGHIYDGEKTGVPERPYMRDYRQTMAMKLFLANPDGKGGSNVRLTFDEALDLIKEVDNVTRGIDKIFYLVGWQFEGHDDKYPAWSEVNKNLKCKNCNHETAKDCLTWLMEEAQKYHTNISFHINSTDSYKDSPLWDEYVANDLISKSGGNFMAIGTWEGETAYQVNYKNEWESGYYKKRVDQLLADFPLLKKAGSIHSDAFFCRASDQSTLAEEQEARRKMYRYWRDCGMDLTSEFIYGTNGSGEQNHTGDGTGLIGLMPMVWHFNQPDTYYMKRPASLITGGGINPGVSYGNDAKNIETLFGKSMWGETLLTTAGVVGAVPGWDQKFIDEFCTATLTWAYLNQFERQEYTGSGNSRTVRYSDGLVTTLADGRSIKKDGKAVRLGDDSFIPAVWKEKEIIAYSANGYTDKTWDMPEGWEDVTSVDLFAVSKSGLTELASDVDCSDGTLTLSLEKGQMVTVVPKDTIALTAPSKFDLLTPEDKASELDPADGRFTWEASKNAVKYHVVVAEDKDLSVNRQEKTVTGTSVDFSEFTLAASKVYYWSVTAEAETGETTKANRVPAQFITVLEGTLERAEDFDVMRYEDNHVRLEWKASKLPYTYHIYRRVQGTGAFEEIGTTTDNFFTDTTASRKDGQVYEYKVRVNGKDEAYADSEIVAVDHEVYLSDLEWSECHEANPDAAWGRIRKDKNLEDAQICMGGYAYEKGIATHANSDVTYALNGQYETFRATIGTDDLNVQRHKPTRFNIQILGDDEEILFEQNDITISNTAIKIEVDVQGVQKITLKVYDPSNNFDSDWGSFGAARLTPKTTVFDKTDLEELIGYAREQQENEDYKYVVPAVKTAFEAALADAEGIIGNPAATQKKVDAAYDKLLKMVHMLDFTGNNTKLDEMVQQVKSLKEELYTASTWAVFETARTKAQGVLDDENVLQAEIDEARVELRNAIFQLRLIPDKGQLEGLIKSAETVDTANYTVKSATAFAAALDNAKAVFADENATEEDVKAAEKALEEAQKNLVVKVDVDQGADKEAGKDDNKADHKIASDNGNNKVASDDGGRKSVDKSVAKTGDSTSVWMIITLCGAALVGISGIIRRRKTTG